MKAVVGSKVQETISFMFQKRKYTYDAEEKKDFVKILYPVQETMSFYLKAEGHETPAGIEDAKAKWGSNE